LLHFDDNLGNFSRFWYVLPIIIWQPCTGQDRQKRARSRKI
jgi:hypothetical protein